MATADNFARQNQLAWNVLANDPHCSYSRPFRDLTANSAWQVINKEEIKLRVRGRNVLCLAAGGGQQSAAFGVLGAKVTVLDIADGMLARDIQTARHYGFRIRVEQGDMRDLQCLESRSFSLVYIGGLAINYVPDATPVITEARRVLRSNGLLHLSWRNPYFGTSRREPNSTRPCSTAKSALNSLKWENANRCHFFPHTLNAIRHLLELNNFIILGIWGTSKQASSSEFRRIQNRMARKEMSLSPFFRIWARKT